MYDLSLKKISSKTWYIFLSNHLITFLSLNCGIVVGGLCFLMENQVQFSLVSFWMDIGNKGFKLSLVQMLSVWTSWVEPIRVFRSTPESSGLVVVHGLSISCRRYGFPLERPTQAKLWKPLWIRLRQRSLARVDNWAL